MRNIRWTDRINLDRAAWARIGVAVGIAVLISSVILLRTAPTKGLYNTDIAAIRADVVGLGTSVTTLTTNINGILALGPLATKAQIDSLSNKLTDHTGNIGSLKTRVTNAETRITTVEAAIGSTPEGYLTGTFGNYTLHAKSNIAGNFTANINLLYTTPVSVGNATMQDEAIQAFYANINWTAPSLKNYVPTLTYNGTTWQVAQVSFNIGVFNMTAGAETTIDITFSGLSNDYKPDFSYVEVFAVLKNE